MNTVSIRQSAEDFQLLLTTGRTQTATITLKPGEATSQESNVHPHSDQVVLILEGEAVVEAGNERAILGKEQCVTIPAGVRHRLINEGLRTVFAFTVYGPPAYETDDPT